MSGSAGHAPTEPSGTQSSVIATGVSASAAGTMRLPRRENAMTNDRR